MAMKQSIVRVLGTFLFLTVIAAGAYAGGYGGFATVLFTQEATLQGVDINSTLFEFDIETGSPMPGENVSFTYTGEIEHNIYPGAIGHLLVGEMSDAEQHSIKELHMDITVTNGDYSESFSGDLLFWGDHRVIEVIVPGGVSQVSINGYCQYGLVADDIDIRMDYVYIICDVCDIDEPEEPEPYIEILSPNGDEELKAGETYDITWNSQGVDELSIMWARYSHDGCGIDADIIYEARASAGSYSWQVPSDLVPSDYYKIVIWDPHPTGDGVQDESDGYFSITEPDHADEERWIFITGNSTHIVSDSPLIISESDNGVMGDENCDILGFWLLTDDGEGVSIASLEIVEDGSGNKGLWLIDVYGGERRIYPSYLKFNILYKTESDGITEELVAMQIIEDGMG